jgi:hypothetical protein
MNFVGSTAKLPGLLDSDFHILACSSILHMYLDINVTWVYL